MQTDVRIHRTGELVTVVLTGPLTLDLVPRVRGILLKCLADCPIGMVVDLTGLTVDSDLPLVVFPTLARHARAWPGGPPVIVCAPPGPVAERFARTRFDRFLSIRESPAEALAALSRQDEPPPALRVELPSGPQAESAARHLVVEACQRWEMPGLAGPAELIAAELAGNAVQHGAPPYGLVAAARTRYLHIVARDGSPELPTLARSTVRDDLSVRTQGLLLVEAFATAWGALRTDGGKAVWATLRREPVASRRLAWPPLLTRAT
jgi:anti-anti-sigma regulatory factor